MLNAIGRFLKEHKFVLIGVGIGALGGYLYYAFVGCSSGACPITSKPFNSSIWGALMGGLLFSSLKSTKNKRK
jgi:hypothetical protein